MAAQGRCSAVVVVALLVASCAVVVQGVDHVVGDAVGWVKPDGTSVPANYLTTWAAGKTFNDGDTLTFNYNAIAHSVMLVSPSDYPGCVTTSALQRHATGKDTIKLVGGTTYNIICGTGSHCKEGQKFTITTTSSTPSAAAAPAFSTATLLLAITASTLAFVVSTIAL